MALCALYASSAKYLLYKLPIPNRFFLMPTSLQKLYYRYSLQFSYSHKTYRQNANLMKLIY